jgi:hypothetical protein
MSRGFVAPGLAIGRLRTNCAGQATSIARHGAPLRVGDAGVTEGTDMITLVVHLLVQIVGGGLAGYALGLKLRDYDPMKHAMYGAIGGVVIAQISRFPISALAGGPDAVSILGNLIAAAIGGALVTAIAGFFKEPFKY